ncbi:MAG TPA: hypothetical protein VF598_12275 [Hymenobacter sp.]|jgi:uncharacterized protein (DUF1778 family)
MKAANDPKPRRPQINLALEAHEKEFIDKVAKLRGVTVSALVRLLAYDEGRRLGLKVPGEE